MCHVSFRIIQVPEWVYTRSCIDFQLTDQRLTFGCFKSGWQTPGTKVVSETNIAAHLLESINQKDSNNTYLIYRNRIM